MRATAGRPYELDADKQTIISARFYGEGTEF
jgi:hypothetical protein